MVALQVEGLVIVMMAMAVEENSPVCGLNGEHDMSLLVCVGK